MFLENHEAEVRICKIISNKIEYDDTIISYRAARVAIKK